jgi:hypothetical protein
MEWKKYKKHKVQLMRDYVLGEDLTGISIADKDLPAEEGGKIARDEAGNMWYVSPEFLKANYTEVVD